MYARGNKATQAFEYLDAASARGSPRVAPFNSALPETASQAFKAAIALTSLGAADCESGIESKRGLAFGSRFIDSTKLHKSRSQTEMSRRTVLVQSLNRRYKSSA